MSLRRSTALLVLSFGVLIAAGCSSGGSSKPTLSLSMSVLRSAGASSVIPPGGQVTINLQALSVSGFSSTGVQGTVSLQVDPPDAGTLSSSSVSLDSTGAGKVTFTMCSSGADCVANTTVSIKGSLSSLSGPATASVQLTIAGDVELTLSAPATTAAAVSMGAMIPVTIHAFHRNSTADAGMADAGASAADAGTGEVPVTGTVQFTAVNGTPSSATVQLDASGNGVVTFNVCSTGTACVMGATASLTGTLLTQGVEATSTVSFTIGTVTTAMDGGTTTGQTSGVYKLTVTVTNRDGTTFSGRTPAGGAPLTITATLTQGGAPPATEQALSISVTNGIGQLSTAPDMTPQDGPITVMTDAFGNAKALLTPENTGAAEGELTVSFTDATTDTDLNVQQLVTVTIPGSLTFAPDPMDAYYTVMGVRGGGWREQNNFRFALLDTTGQPYTGSAVINFSIPNLGGAKLVPTSINTDANGQAVTSLYAGISAGTIAVTASTTVAISPTYSVTLSTTSDTVAVVGSKASGRNFSVSCHDLSLPALWGNDCTYMHVDVNTTCTAVLGDRFGNVVGRAGEVTWMSEAGLFGPPSFTPPATAGNDPLTQPDLGRTANILHMLNAPIPLDVTPFPNEPSAMFPAGSLCGARTSNPRDGLITFIVATQGEEGFTDSNGNGKWDPGEPFFDQGEPYVDSNDNNQWDPGEQYIDVNGNGQYDGPNGTWDANTTIWTEGHLVVSGDPLNATNGVFSVPPAEGGTWTPDPIPPVPLTLGTAFEFVFEDGNLNETSPNFSTYDAILLQPAKGSIQFQSQETHLVDKLGSMTVAQPTVCGPSPVSGTCTAQNPNCDCMLSTKISFDGPRALVAGYGAPGLDAAPGGVDTVQITDTVLVGQDIITVVDGRPIVYGSAQ